MVYRPGGFPEYSPQEQKVFDTVQDIIRRVFEQHNFQHIWTPAVESNEILLKGGDTVVNEIFGLVGLRDYESGEYDRALKSYSLHFDLTVPFARYALDHMSELTFPFKRYQIQPVRRGERQQRGRFKEFWQCDVDSIRRAGTELGSWYGANTIATLQQALQSVVNHFDLSQGFVSHVSHVGLIKSWLADVVEDENRREHVIKLFDNFHKLQRDEFDEQLIDLLGEDSAGVIVDAIDAGSDDFLSGYAGYDHLHNTLEILEKLGAKIVFDPTIVRGLGYYTDIVFETFLDSDKSLGSICSGGGYENFTEFIDAKNVFSGIGGSIGLSRLMEIVLGSQGLQSERSESYLFVNFEETFDQIINLYQQFVSQGKICDIYPVADKFGKQFGYADKSGYSHVVMLGENELENGEYQIKNLKSGEVKSVELKV